MRESILENVRAKQSVSELPPEAAPGSIRFIVEFDRVAEPAEIEAALKSRLGVDVAAARLSAAHGEQGADDGDGLANFLAVVIPGVVAEDLRPSPFEMGYAIADATGALTAEPELGTDFYVVPPTDDTTEGIESFPPGCWVDPNEDPTEEHPFWAVDAIKAVSAWSLTPAPGGQAKGKGIFIFQPDTGVADHSELGGDMIDRTLPYDFVDNKPGATDPLDYRGNPGHGTGTASVAAGRGISKLMSGSAPAATLVPLRAITSVIVFDHGRVAAAVEYARRHKADVITMSLGGGWSSSLRAAIKRAIDDGAIVLAAAGNCFPYEVVWPARYEEVIAVAGYNKADKPWKGSCRGDAVDITAPAEFVPRANRSESNNGNATDVRGGQGTSFAVALTAGVAALWLAHHGRAAIASSLRPKETFQQRFLSVLQASARRPDPWREDQFGAGIVDAAALLRRAIVSPEDGVEMVAPARGPLHSLQTLLRDVARSASEGGPDGAQPVVSRRYAAELSHLALDTARTRGQGAVERSDAGAIAHRVIPSETLQREMALAGQQAVLETWS